MNDFENFALHYGTTVETLREIVHDHCDIHRGWIPGIVDGWLFDRLSIAASLMGPHFSVATPQDVLFAISYPLDRDHGTVLDRCRHSWAEYMANPFIGRHHRAPEPYSFVGSAEPGAAVSESGGDVMSNWLLTRPD